MLNAGFAGRLVRVPNNESADIIVRQRDTGSNFGIAFIDGVGGCQVHSTLDNDTIAAEIHFDVRSDWFTQDDSRRGYWEQQCPAGTGTSYTCSKNFDFGGLIMHEIGHALGFISHPEAVDSHHSDPDRTAFNAAVCFSVTAKSTMCARPLDKWRTGSRVLEIWDMDSWREHARVHANH
jgi:hypothetical protein